MNLDSEPFQGLGVPRPACGAVTSAILGVIVPADISMRAPNFSRRPMGNSGRMCCPRTTNSITPDLPPKLTEKRTTFVTLPRPPLPADQTFQIWRYCFHVECRLSSSKASPMSACAAAVSTYEKPGSTDREDWGKRALDNFSNGLSQKTFTRAQKRHCWSSSVHEGKRVCETGSCFGFSGLVHSLGQ